MVIKGNQAPMAGFSKKVSQDSLAFLHSANDMNKNGHKNDKN
jgi:hypothetical protein